MASKKIEVEITATDKASAKLDRVEKQADRIEADPINLDLNVDTADLDRAESKLGGLTSSMGGLSSMMTGPAGVAAGGTALAAGMLAAAQHTADIAIDAQVTASLTGAALEDVSRLQTVWKQTGADVNDLNDILLNMNGVLAASPELASQLHVNLNDGATGIERMLGLLEQLNTSQLSANEKALIMGQLFGEEGVRQVGKLLALFPDLEAALAGVGEAQVVSAEDVERAREFNAELGKMKTEGADLAAIFGSTLIPVFTELFGFLNTGITTFEDWGRAARDAIDSTARANHENVDAFEASERAAADFDTKVLDGLNSFDQVHAKVLELTDDYYAANVIATAWVNTHKALAEAMPLSGGFGHAPAAGLAAIREANLESSAAATAKSQARINQTIIMPFASPELTYNQLDTFLGRNSARTEG